MDPHTRDTMQMDESFGGTYVTDRVQVAKQYAVHAAGYTGGDKLLLALQVETRTPGSALDEDLLFGPAQRALGAVTPDDSTDAYLWAEDEADWNDIAAQYLEEEFPDIELHKARLEKALPRLGCALKNYYIGSLLQNVWDDIDIELDKRFGDGLEVYADDYIAEYQDCARDATMMLKELTSPEATGGTHNIRLTQPIGFSGANQILAAVSWWDAGYGDEPDTGTVWYSKDKEAANTLVESVGRNRTWYWPDGTEIVPSGKKAAQTIQFAGHQYSVLTNGSVDATNDVEESRYVQPRGNRNVFTDTTRNRVDRGRSRTQHDQNRTAQPTRQVGDRHRPRTTEGQRDQHSPGMARPRGNDPAAGPGDASVHHLASNKLGRQAGNQPGDFGDQFDFGRWVDLTADDLRRDPELAQQLFDLIVNAYKKIPGGHAGIDSPMALVQDNVILHAIDLDQDPEPDGVIPWKKKPAGDKITGLGYDDEHAKDTLTEFGRLIHTTNYYAEISSPMSGNVWDYWPDVTVIEDEKQARSILNKDIEWLGQDPTGKEPHDGWYTRDIGGQQHTKILIGLPKVAQTRKSNGRNPNAQKRDRPTRTATRTIGGRVDAERQKVKRNKKRNRKPSRVSGGTVGASAETTPGIKGAALSMTLPSNRIPHIRVALDEVTTLDPTLGPQHDGPSVGSEGPSKSKLVDQLERDPGAHWKDLYLQPIIRAIRNRFDLEKGQVVLVGPRKKVPFGTDTLGFDVQGHVRFEDFVPPEDQHGTAPFRFLAHVDPQGELMLPIEVRGGAMDGVDE